LAKTVSLERAFTKKYETREVEVTDCWKLEFYDFQQVAEDILSPVERELRRPAGYAERSGASWCHQTEPAR
jgi:hypothetical protein